MALKIFEGEERIADLSKGWQQFALGVILFYIVFIGIAAISVLSFFSPALGSTTAGLGGFPGGSSLLMFAYGFGAVFFLIKFIKRYNMNSVTDFGFGISLIAGVLLLLAFLTLYELAPIIMEALGETARTSFGSIGYSATNVFKTAGSFVFYIIAGFGLAFLGNRFNKGSTPILGIFSILIVPMLLLATLFSFGTFVDSGITMLLNPPQSTSFYQAAPSFNQLISQIVLFFVFLVLSVVLTAVLHVKSEARALYFPSLAFKIAGAGFLVSLLFSLIGFSTLLATDFQNTELMKTLAIFGEWLLKVVFFTVMAFVLFRVQNELKGKSAAKPKLSLK